MSKSGDRFEKLVSEARNVSGERADVLRSIRENEASLPTAEGALAAAQKRTAEEEFEAAQKPRGLAIASTAALEAVADAQLKVKSIKVRLTGLRTKLAGTDQRLSAVKSELLVYRDNFIGAKILELRDKFDDAIEALIPLLCETLALYDVCGDGVRAKCSFEPYQVLFQTIMINPVDRARSGIFNKQFSRTRDGHELAIRQNWRQHPEADQLCKSIQAITDRITEAVGDGG